MGFRLANDEALENALPRCIAEQIDHARSQLQLGGTELHEGIHNARRAIRRARAAQALLRHRLDDAAWREFSAALREAGGLLSPLRDAQSVIEAVAWDPPQGGVRLPAATRQQLLQGLRRRRDRLLRTSQGAIAAADAALKRSLDGQVSAFADFDPADLSKGLREGHRRLHRALNTALRRTDDSATLHRFRQTARMHWLQIELVSEAWPAVLGAQATELKRLSQTLGRERDLLLLSERVAGLRAPLPGARSAAAVQRDIARLQATLRQRAFALGRLVCAESGRALAARIAAWRALRAATQGHRIGDDLAP